MFLRGATGLVWSGNLRSLASSSGKWKQASLPVFHVTVRCVIAAAGPGWHACTAIGAADVPGTAATSVFDKIIRPLCGNGVARMTRAI
jgi:hypothetical protein